MTKKFWSTIILLAIILLGWRFYKFLNPSAPDLDFVENSIRDRAVKDWAKLEKSIPPNTNRNAYFGDLHVHTKYSFDAFIGGVSAGPDEAYQFAKGGEINVLDKLVKIQRPLDFTAVTDHSEYLGEMYSAQHKEAKGYATLPARYLRSLDRDTAKQRELFNRMRNVSDPSKVRNHPNFFRGFKTTMSAWDRAIEAAEKHYTPGTFTTFAGYEWTLGKNVFSKRAHLHRNVIFRDMNVPDYPVSAFEARDEIALWESLDEYRSGGSTVLAIPHNSNISHGMMFPFRQPDGKEIDSNYVETRNFNEPLVEIHQAKGNSEVHPKIWTSDEYADFEMYEEEDIPNENNFIRNALKRGLKYKEELGTNPYEYGLIGSTDTHNGTPGNTEEDDDYQGNKLITDTDLNNRLTSDWILNTSIKTYNAINPGGLIGVWAEANTRPYIYDAMARKETYATSGGRVMVRFFAGYDYSENYKSYDAMVTDGYAKGVAMGQHIKAKSHVSPEFLIWASKDPLGANLDRIQIIKGWYEDEVLNEQIIDVVVSENAVDQEDEVVNLKTGEIDLSKGQSILFTKWRDSEFDANVQTFYYLRVLEVPTPRYTLWDEIKYDVTYPADMKRTIRERAWSSPIWYYPS